MRRGKQIKGTQMKRKREREVNTYLFIYNISSVCKIE
jgi:hypothetical protein